MTAFGQNLCFGVLACLVKCVLAFGWVCSSVLWLLCVALGRVQHFWACSTFFGRVQLFFAPLLSPDRPLQGPPSPQNFALFFLSRSQRGKKEKCGGRGKKREIFGLLHPSRPHPWEPPPFGTHFSGFVAHPSGPHSLPTPTHPIWSNASGQMRNKQDWPNAVMAKFGLAKCGRDRCLRRVTRGLSSKMLGCILNFRGWSTLPARVQLVISRLVLLSAQPLEFYGRVWVVRSLFIPGALHGIEASLLASACANCGPLSIKLFGLVVSGWLVWVRFSA